MAIRSGHAANAGTMAAQKNTIVAATNSVNADQTAKKIGAVSSSIQRDCKKPTRKMTINGTSNTQDTNQARNNVISDEGAPKINPKVLEAISKVWSNGLDFWSWVPPKD